jgi:hypothetical protein
MARRIKVYVEQGAKRAYAGGIDWPGWDRGGRDESGALEAMVAAGERYLTAVGEHAADLAPPGSADDLEVVERVRGNATTDFGIPGIGPAADGDAVKPDDMARLLGILEAAWSAFDTAARNAIGGELRKGPRGGGRELEKIIEHVLGGQRAYVTSIGGRRLGAAPEDPGQAMTETREAAREALRALARGTPIEVRSGRKAKLWTPRYFVRRSAWHALDHAWEIEDRIAPG